jgi:DNA-binding NarL/FixJ family response regulator
MPPVGNQPSCAGEGGELHERSHVLDALGAGLGRAAAGQGSLVLLSGEAGVGKTAVLRRFTRQLAGQARILWGACDPLFTPRPLGPFLDIAGQPGGELAGLLGQGAKPHQILPVLLRELSGGKPTVAVVEDVHWADEASLDLLGLASRRIEHIGVLVIASFRDDELDPAHPLRTVLGRLATVPGVSRLDLEPLSLSAVTAMAAPYGADATELFEKTGGNPFFVTEVLGCGSAGVPPTVRDAVLARASAAGEQGRRLLEAVAIVPSSVEPWLLESLAGSDLEYFGRCRAAGMLTEQPSGIGFRHELARLAIEQAIPPARRITLHRAALRALMASAQGGADPARLAHHAEQANDSEAVLRLAPVAAERAAAVGAHREAAAQYGRALRFAESLPAEARAGLHERHSYECFLSDQPGLAIEARRQALASYRTLGDKRGEGDSLCWLARLLLFASRDAEAEESAQAAIAVLEELPPGRELAMTYSTVSHMRLLAGDLAAAISWGRRAVALAEQLGETEVLVHALNNVGSAEFSHGDDRGRQTLEHSLELARGAGLAEHVARAYVNLASTAVDLRRYDIADRYLAAGAAHASDRGVEAWQWYLVAVRARSELERGHWAQAVASAETVLGAARPASFARLTALTVVARVRARRGEPGYWPLLDEALRIADLNGHLQQAGPVAAARAEAAWLEGRYAAVPGETRDCLRLARKLGDPWIAGELACWQRRAGLAAQQPRVAAGPYALQFAGDWAAAAHRWLALGCPYEASLALADSQDEQALQKALTMLNGLGARPAAAAVARRLRTLGVRRLPRVPRASTARNPAGLTGRELEILGLVVQGLANGQIAGRLVISPKTVEHHVSAILRKLGVQSRSEARLAAASHGLTRET